MNTVIEGEMVVRTSIICNLLGNVLQHMCSTLFGFKNLYFLTFKRLSIVSGSMINIWPSWS